MTAQQPAHGLDDGSDLRAYVEAVIRYKWLILGIVAGVMAVTAIVNYFLLSPMSQP